MWSDKESDIDYLNFSEIAEQAVDIITSPNMLPISLGIFGSWGAGKSSLLKLVEKKLTSLADNKKKYIVVNFDAWLYQGYDDSRAALLEIISNELNKSAKDEESILKKTKNLLARIKIFRLLGLGAEGIAIAHGIPTGGLLFRGLGEVGNLVNSIQENDDFTQEEYQELSKTAKESKDTLMGLLKNTSEITPPQQITAFRKEYSEILTELSSRT